MGPLNQLHLSRLSGLVEAEDGIVGLLMNYIETAQPDLSYVLMEEESVVPPEQREKWISQISNTLQELHKMDIVWGDATTANVIID